MLRRASTLLLLAVLSTLPAANAELAVGAFSEADPGAGLPLTWEPLAFQEIEPKTEYRLVARDGQVVIRAVSDGGASGLVRRVNIDPTEYPILEWRWWVSNTLEGGNARVKRGDDYPARLYIMFDYQGLGFFDRMRLRTLRLLGYDEIPTRALNYIWASSVPRGQMLPSAYTDWVMMVPLRSGEQDAGQWVREIRNVVADYGAAFGGTPPRINGVAIMTDTDNTGGSATAYYGDIVFRRATGER